MRALSNPSFAAVVVATLARRTKLNFPLSSPALAHAAGLVSLALMGPSVSGVRIAAAAVHYCIPSPVTKLWRRSGILRRLTVSNPE